MRTLRSRLELGAQPTDPVPRHGSAVRKIVTRLEPPRGDHGQHEDPALANQRLISAGIVRADLDGRSFRPDGRMRDVELDRPTTARLEVDEQKPIPRPEHVARVRLAMQQLLGRASLDDRPAHRSQRRSEQIAVRAGDLRVVVRVIDQPLRLVDSIHEVRHPMLGELGLSHAGVHLLERAGVLIGRDVGRRYGFVVGPERDRKAVSLVDARLDARIEHRDWRTGVGEASSHLDLEPGAVLPRPRRDSGEYIARPKVHREPVRIVQHDGTVDTQTALDGHCDACGPRPRNLRCVHANTLWSRSSTEPHRGRAAVGETTWVTFPNFGAKHGEEAIITPESVTAVQRQRTDLVVPDGVVFAYQRTVWEHFDAMGAGVVEGYPGPWRRLRVLERDNATVGLVGGFGIGAPVAAMILEELIARCSPLHQHRRGRDLGMSVDWEDRFAPGLPSTVKSREMSSCST